MLGGAERLPPARCRLLRIPVSIAYVLVVVLIFRVRVTLVLIIPLYNISQAGSV